MFRVCLSLALLAACAAPSAAGEGQRRPNIVVLYLDDMGYGQPGCYGGKLAPTPNIDSIAKNGVRCTDGYVSACICSPSRVGLLTGRYQARTGHDANSTREGRELDAKEVTIAQRLRALGYVTGVIGKWHVGDTSDDFLPTGRGFDFFTGHTGNVGEKKGRYLRGTEPMKMPDHPVTTPRWAAEAVDFIEKHQKQPFFLYLAFNAVHAPHVATEKALQRFANLDKKRDQNYAAMIAEADEAVGSVLSKLRALKLEEDTLIFVISDNGGAAGNAEMGGLRGRKWYLFEGGVRVPFLVQWKGHIPPGGILREPVIQLDVLPTAIAAAGGEVRPGWHIDGVNLLPLLQGKQKQLGRQALYWRFGNQYAIRQGDWKLVKALKDHPAMLFNLAKDPGEKTDLVKSHPDKARELQARWDAWNASVVPPRWEDRRWDRTETGVADE